MKKQNRVSIILYTGIIAAGITLNTYANTKITNSVYGVQYNTDSLWCVTKDTDTEKEYHPSGSETDDSVFSISFIEKEDGTDYKDYIKTITDELIQNALKHDGYISVNEKGSFNDYDCWTLGISEEINGKYIDTYRYYIPIMEGILLVQNQFNDDVGNEYYNEFERFESSFIFPLVMPGEPFGTNELEYDEKAGIRFDISSHASSTYEKTKIDSINVNDDASEYGKLVVLIDATWNVKNSEDTSEKMLRMYSDDMAAYLGEKYENISSVTIFWKVPYLTEQTTKYQYSRNSSGMYLEDSAIGWK